MGKPMRTRILVVLALATATALAVVPAATAGTRAHALQATLKMAVIGPNGQSGSTFAGELVGKPTGRSAVVLRNTVSGSTSTGKAVVYTSAGKLFATIRNEIQPQPDGSVRVPGTYKITGGTRRYRGATGSGTFDGGVPANSTIFEIKLTGKIRY
jgi:hypothetical protein